MFGDMKHKQQLSTGLHNYGMIVDYAAWIGKFV